MNDDYILFESLALTSFFYTDYNILIPQNSGNMLNQNLTMFNYSFGEIGEYIIDLYNVSEGVWIAVDSIFEEIESQLMNDFFLTEYSFSNNGATFVFESASQSGVINQVDKEISFYLSSATSEEVAEFYIDSIENPCN